MYWKYLSESLSYLATHLKFAFLHPTKSDSVGLLTPIIYAMHVAPSEASQVGTSKGTDTYKICAR